MEQDMDMTLTYQLLEKPGSAILGIKVTTVLKINIFIFKTVVEDKYIYLQP
jgi:hypothetical protein